jgi:hypothetical protein
MERKTNTKTICPFCSTASTHYFKHDDPDDSPILIFVACRIWMRAEDELNAIHEKALPLARQRAKDLMMSTDPKVKKEMDTYSQIVYVVHTKNIHDGSENEVVDLLDEPGCDTGGDSDDGQRGE